MIRRPPISTQSRSSAASDVYKRQLLILRPGTAAFQPAMLWAVAGVAGLTLRDLATRSIPPGVASDQLSASAYGAMIPAGVVLGLLAGPAPVMPGPIEVVLLAGAVVSVSYPHLPLPTVLT